MSLLSSLFNAITDNDEKENITYPCSNCESSCSVYPKACEECKPYKEKLLDALYNVEHLEEFNAKYEVVAAGTAPAGVTECPYCGAPATGAVCEYCGSRIAESNGKIQVSSASEIPNPIIEARNIIYERRTVIDRYSDTESDSKGILGSIVSALSGNDSDENSLGTAMTESEIKAMAEKYSVSVKEYLEGLDMGTYLTKKAYEKQQSAASYSTAGMAAGAAGIGAAAGMAFGGSQSHHRPPEPQRPEPQHGMQQHNQNRPPMGNQSRPDHMGPQQGMGGNSGAFGHSGNRPSGGNVTQHGTGRPSSNQQSRPSGRPSGNGGGRPSEGQSGHGGGPRGGGRGTR